MNKLIVILIYLLALQCSGDYRSQKEINEYCDKYLLIGISGVADLTNNPDTSKTENEINSQISSMTIGVIAFDYKCRHPKRY